MPKILDPDLLRVGTELTIDTAAKTFALTTAGAGNNITAKDGVSLQALYSKFKELWLTSTYQPYPFPAYCIDAEAGKYQFGTDGDKFSGWKPADTTTRNLLRDGGWEEYSSGGSLNRVYAGIVTLGTVGATDQLYYQLGASDAAANFVYPGAVNEGVQVYGDAGNGNFDKRTFFKVFAREYAKKYDQKQLADSGYTGTGPRLLTFAVSNETDLKVIANDAAMAGAPYSGITITYYGTDQMKAIGGSSYPFRVIIAGNGANLEQIYTKIQYLLRQNADIDAGAGTVTGKTADALLGFVGNDLYTKQGVFIENFDANDSNRIYFTDQNGVVRTLPFVAAGTLAFNTNLVNDPDAVYRMYFASGYGGASAITVQDATGDPIAGSVGGLAEISFDFAYDSNVQGGRTAGTNAAVIVIASGKNGSKYVSAEATITRAVGQRIALVAEKERSYVNP